MFVKIYLIKIIYIIYFEYIYIMKLELIIVFLVMLLFGCGSQKTNSLKVISVSKSDVELEYVIDSLSIDVEDSGLFYYPLFSNIKIGVTNYFFGWNHTNNKLDIINLGNLKLERSIKYDVDGPNGIGKIKGLNVVSFDSIFFLSDKRLVLVDTTSKIVADWGINSRNEFAGFDQFAHNITTEENFNIQYNRKTKKIYARLHFPMYSWCDESLDYYKENIVAELDLKHLIFKELQIKYPEFYTQRFYGFRDIPAVSFDNRGYITFDFSVHSNLYQYDIDSESVEIFGGASDFTDNHASFLQNQDCNDTRAGMKHNLLNVKFLQIQYDPFKHLYYRFHWSNIPEHKINGKYSSYNDKRLYLSVFDESFGKIDEIELDRKHGAVWSFITENGLYVLKPRGTENLLGFSVIKFNRI